MNTYLKKLLLAGESEVLDFKQTVNNASKIAKTMVSFANTKGGILLVGVRDNKTISGVRSEEEKYMLDMAASFYCNPEIALQIIELEAEGKTILEVRIKEGHEKPYYAKGEDGNWWVYVRAADKSLLASKTTVDYLKREAKGVENSLHIGWLESGILQYLNNNHRITISEVSKKFNVSKRRASKVLVTLMSMRLVQSHTTEKAEFYTLV